MWTQNRLFLQRILEHSRRLLLRLAHKSKLLCLKSIYTTCRRMPYTRQYENRNIFFFCSPLLNNRFVNFKTFLLLETKKIWNLCTFVLVSYSTEMIQTYTKFCENKTLAKISEFTVLYRCKTPEYFLLL